MRNGALASILKLRGEGAALVELNVETLAVVEADEVAEAITVNVEPADICSCVSFCYTWHGRVGERKHTLCPAVGLQVEAGTIHVAVVDPLVDVEGVVVLGPNGFLHVVLDHLGNLDRLYGVVKVFGDSDLASVDDVLFASVDEGSLVGGLEHAGLLSLLERLPPDGSHLLVASIRGMDTVLEVGGAEPWLVRLVHVGKDDALVLLAAPLDKSAVLRVDLLDYLVFVGIFGLENSRKQDGDARDFLEQHVDHIVHALSHSVDLEVLVCIVGAGAVIG